MKFCKNLQRVVEISDPEWAPYWPNYKMLKKLIKELPSLVPAEEGKQEEPKATEARPRANSHSAVTIGKSPGEVAFFKLLHTEFKKTTHFFERCSQEFSIREERVREGMNIMRQPNSIMLNEKWSTMARSVHRLYKDLLLLETFAIMTYCSFSKILKKHDKVTGYETRSAFMESIVNKANFTHYPKLLEMIQRCESMHEEVSTYLLREGKQSLYEDERLFISMISRLNEQVLTGEDSPTLRGGVQNETSSRRYSLASLAEKKAVSPSSADSATSKLRSLLEENQRAQKSGTAHEEGVARVAEEESSVDGDSHQCQKRRAQDLEGSDSASKRPRQV